MTEHAELDDADDDGDDWVVRCQRALDGYRRAQSEVDGAVTRLRHEISGYEERITSITALNYLTAMLESGRTMGKCVIEAAPRLNFPDHQSPHDWRRGQPSSDAAPREPEVKEWENGKA